MNALEARELVNNVLLKNPIIAKAYEITTAAIERNSMSGKCYIILDNELYNYSPDVRKAIKHMLLAEGYKSYIGEDLGKLYDGREYMVW